MHDRLLTALQQVADVSLVASLRDHRLGFPFQNDLRVFIPDLHLISNGRLATGGFRFATNHEPLLIRVIGALKALKLATGANEQVNVIHLGDILDLWREVERVDPGINTPVKIAEDHIALMNALTDEDLDATIFLGNHDFELYHWPEYAGCVRRLHIPPENSQVLILHGDVFDWLEKLPDPLQQWGVYYFAPLKQPSDIELGQMAKFVRDATPPRDTPTSIRNTTPAKLGGLLQLDAANVPAEFNLQRSNDANAAIEFLELAYRHVGKTGNRYQQQIKTVVIGHTHHARIAVREEAGELFTLMDCGAWIENCSPDGAGNPVPCAQIGALCNNEARIYQLAPLG